MGGGGWGLNILTEQDLISTNQSSNDVSHAVWQKTSLLDSAQPADALRVIAF